MTPRREASPFPPHDVLILGAGLAGLSAALTLAESGFRPLLLEAAPTPGGRIRAFFHPHLDTVLDTGPHLLVGACKRTMALMERLGVRALLRPLPKLGLPFWTEEEGFHALSCPSLLPAPLHLIVGLLGFSPLPRRARLAPMRLAVDLLRPPPRLEEESVTQWLERRRQPPELLHRLWTPLCLAILNEPPGSANAALLANVLREAFFTQREAARILLPGAPLEEIFIPPALARLNALGGTLLCRTRITALEVHGERLGMIHTSRGPLSAPAVTIAALPHAALARLLPPWAKAAGFGALAHSPILSVTLRWETTARLPQPLLGLPFHASQWLFDLAALRGWERGTLIAAVLSAAHREASWPTERLTERIRAEVIRILPALAHEPPRMAVRREMRATFAPWPGSSALRPGTHTPWSNLLLAGDWTATGLPATMEGAVISGEAAARVAHGLLSRERGIV